jgi:hypothetical protein
MSQDFKELLKLNGQTHKWFYDVYISPYTSLTYSGFMSQINGYSPISSFVKKQIYIYKEKIENGKQQ